MESEITLRVANQADNQMLCDLARNSVMSGVLDVVYARDPDYFHGLNIQGKTNHVCIFEKDKKMVAMGSRCMKPVYVNEEKKVVGYLSGLRAVKRLRGGVTGPIFNLLKVHHQQEFAPIYINTVIDNNKLALNSLTGKRPGMPNYVDFGAYTTHLLVFKNQTMSTGDDNQLSLIRGSESTLGEIVQFINRVGKAKQFFPVYERNDFKSAYTRGFKADDFYVAIKQDSIAGVIGKWDQAEFKQNIITGIHWEWIKEKLGSTVNFDIADYKNLVVMNKPIKSFYLSFVCIENNDPKVLRFLIDKVLGEHMNSGYQYCVIGFHTQDPLREALKGLATIDYTSRLFLVCWEEGLPYLESLNHQLVPYLETAAL
ncbi:MAG: hypothetical protein MJE63_27850 [Proteobacteria bacterium]|nr:hypothetical protein [Pseudomonadota bacterium]